jgi:hypothetical protein
MEISADYTAKMEEVSKSNSLEIGEEGDGISLSKGYNSSLVVGTIPNKTAKAALLPRWVIGIDCNHGYIKQFFNGSPNFNFGGTGFNLKDVLVVLQQ